MQSVNPELNAIFRDANVADKMATVSETGEQAFYAALHSGSLEDINKAFNLARSARNNAKLAAQATTATPAAKKAFYEFIDDLAGACNFAQLARQPTTTVQITSTVI
jgi:hypothetical protein